MVGGAPEDNDAVHGDTDRVPGGHGVREGIADWRVVPRRHRAPGATSVRVGEDGRREEGIYGHPRRGLMSRGGFREQPIPT